jgi:predicted ATP-dependent endonuclease of OLD family
MRLKQITMQRFGGFRDFSLEVGDVTVLVGRNNSGKTTILRSVKIACEAITAVFGTPA